MKTITCGIIAKNEQENIKDCIKSAQKISSEILIIDSGSNDDTVKFAKEAGAKVLFNEFKDFVKQKNLLIKNTDTEWIFVLDADERVSDDLAHEIKTAVSKAEANGYYIPRRSFYINRFIKYSGWSPDYVLRLFKTKKGIFVGNLVHEKVRIDGPGKKLKNPIIHYPYKDIASHVSKINHYTDLYALGNPQKTSSLPKILFNTVYKFIKTYIFQLGFMDKKAGILLSIMASYYTYLKYLKLYERDLKK